jgi:hypothetical protein
MGLYERLIGGELPENEPKIAVHQFMAAMESIFGSIPAECRSS